MSEEKSLPDQEAVLNTAEALITLAKARDLKPNQLIGVLQRLDEQSAENVAFTLSGKPSSRIIKDVIKALKPSED